MEHLAEHLRVESFVLCECASAQVCKAIAVSHSGKIDEVSSLRPPEHGKDLVHGQLLSGEDRPEFPSFYRHEPGVGCEVDLGHLAAASHLEADEPCTFSNASDVHAGIHQSALGCGHQAIDIRGGRTEEIEITSLTLDVTSGDERGASG